MIDFLKFFIKISLVVIPQNLHDFRDGKTGIYQHGRGVFHGNAVAVCHERFSGMRLDDAVEIVPAVVQDGFQFLAADVAMACLQRVDDFAEQVFVGGTVE